MTSAVTNSFQAHERIRVHELLKKGVWLYFMLLIFEGALRKWFLPFLSGPLLLVRDPIALVLLIMAYRNGFLVKSIYSTLMILVGIIAFFTAMFVGHGNFAVAIYGVRILIINFPLMFVIGGVFDRNDVIKLGKATLWICIIMTVLIALQFYSPQSAWVNRGLGGDIAGAGFSGSMGYFRPPGTFSFTNGTTLFFGLSSCFIFYFWLQPKTINKKLLLIATGCLIAAIPLSISRTLFFQTGVCIFFAFCAVIRKPQYLGRVAAATFGAVILIFILSKASFFQTSTEAFTSRFEDANVIEGGLQGSIGDRYFGGMMSALTNSNKQSFFGAGIGMGTNVGSSLLTGSSGFLISEEEWGRMIGEMGPLLGILAISIRLGLSFRIAKESYRKLKKDDFLPWMLLSFALLTIPQIQWAQPTALGFSTIIGGLVLASFNSKTIQPNRKQRIYEDDINRQLLAG